MDNLQIPTADRMVIDTGVKRIMINDGPAYVEFNPTDVLFAERFYKLLADFKIKIDEYKARADELDRENIGDISGLPSNLPEGLAMMHEICDYMRGQIDYLFGAGTSQKAFGDVYNLSVFDQFFRGLGPFIQTARADKIAQYVRPVVVGRKRHKVMK
jgi:hypothetical protein